MKVRIIDDFNNVVVAYATFEDEADFEKANKELVRYREFCSEFDDVVTYLIKDALTIIERYATDVNLIDSDLKIMYV